MQFESYGDAGKEIILLLHGGGLGPWNYRRVAGLLCDDYRVVLPVLDGHAGSDAPFTSIESNALRIIDFVKKEFGGRVLLMGGLSLGAQILVDILAKQPDICRCALIESALVFPMKLTKALAGPMLDMSYSLIAKPWFSKLQFDSLKMDPEYFEEYRLSSCGISKESMTAFLRANADFPLPEPLKNFSGPACICVGQKEMSIMRRSAKALHAALPASCLKILPGLYHGQFSLNRPEDFAALIRSMAE